MKPESGNGHSQGYVEYLGRDYLKVGYYTEIFFVERDVRYIAINDGVDSAKGDNDFTPFATCLTIFAPKIPAKKVRAIKTGARHGGGTSDKAALWLHGSPTDKKQWIVDEKSRRCGEADFDLCIDGKGP